MNLRTKIILPKLAIIIILAASFSYFLYYLIKNNRLVEETQTRAQEVIAYSHQLDKLQKQIEDSFLVYSLTRDRFVLSDIELDRAEIRRIVEVALSRTTDDQEKYFLQKYKANYDGAGTTTDQFIAALRAGNSAELPLSFKKWEIKSQVAHATLDDLVVHNARTLERLARLFTDVIRKVIQIAFFILVVSIVLTLGNFYFLYFYITIPLLALIDYANEISRGNFHRHVRVRSTDELGQLSSSLRNMAHELSSLYRGLESEVERKTQELSNRNAELARSNKELEDFAYIASHDLQEPLRKIQAFGNVLDEEYKDTLGTTGRDYLSRMRNAAKRMSVLISDLLAYSRVTTKAQPFETVDLNAILKDVLSDLEARIKETRGKVKAEPLPTVEADSLQMRQLIQNLISNSLKFHRKRAHPVVRVYSKPSQEKKEYWDIFVEDNGIGIDEAYMDKIFSVFQRLHTREEYEGTGVGLAIAKKIVDRHKGSIKIRSVIGRGTTFVITLPTSQQEDYESKPVITN